MGNKKRQPGRPKFRFGFTGPLRKPETDDVTVDDILDSMSRRVGLSRQMDPETLTPIEEEPESFVRLKRSFRGSWRAVFSKIALAVSVLTSALLILSFASPGGPGAFSSLDGLTKDPSIAAIFDDPLRLLIAVIVCAIPLVLFERKKKRKSNLMLR